MVNTWNLVSWLLAPISVQLVSIFPYTSRFGNPSSFAATFMASF